MITIKFNQIKLEEIERQYYREDKELDILVSNKITGKMYFVKSRDIMFDYETYRKNVADGWYRLYIKVFEGREICTDDVDLQDELDDIDILNGLSKEMKNDNDDLDDDILIDKMYDDGIFNYGEEQ